MSNPGRFDVATTGLTATSEEVWADTTVLTATSDEVWADTTVLTATSDEVRADTTGLTSTSDEVRAAATGLTLNRGRFEGNPDCKPLCHRFWIFNDNYINLDGIKR